MAKARPVNSMVKKGTDIMPLSGRELRDFMLTNAGLTQVQQAELLRKAAAAQEEALTATQASKVRRTVDPEGQETVEVTEGGAPDWQTRLRAAEAVEDLVLPKASKDSGDQGPTRIAVVIAGYARAPQALKAEVVEAG